MNSSLAATPTLRPESRPGLRSVDRVALRAYLESRRGASIDEPARRALVAWREAYQRRDATRALAAIEAVGSKPDGVMGVRVTFARAAALQFLARREEAVRAFLEAADAAERLGWLARAGLALQLGGVLAQERSDFVVARAALERCVGVHRRRGHRGDESIALGNLGNVLYSLGDYAKALELYQQAMRTQQELGDRTSAALTLGSIGNVHWVLGDLSRALEVHRQALALKEALGDRPGIAATLTNLGSVLSDRGAYAEALEIDDRALAMLQELGDRGGAARVLGNIGVVHQRVGRYSKALEIDQRAVTMFEVVEDRASVALTLGNIGNVYSALGDFRKALDYQQRALELKLRLGDRAGAALTVGNIGLIHSSLGSYATALDHLERALAEQSAVGVRGHLALTLGNIGNVHAALGDHERALAYDTRALGIFESAGDRAGAARSLVSIGNTHAEFGDVEKALEFMGRALAMERELGGRADEAGTLSNIAALELRRGDARRAVEYGERAFALQTDLGDRSGAALTLVNLGLARSMLGEHALANALLDRAVHAAERMRASDVLVRALRAAARVRLDAGDPAVARERAHAAVTVLESVVGGLAEEQGAGAREQFADLFAIGAAASVATDDVAEAVHFLESGRAGSLLETLGGRQALRRVALPDELRVAQSESRAQEAVALEAYARALDGLPIATVRERRRELDAARERSQEVAARLQRDAKRAARLWYPRAAPLDEIQGWLAPGDALVVYAIGLGKVSAVVVTPDAARVVALGPAEAVEEALSALAAHDPLMPAGAALERLRELLLTPLRLPEGTRRLLVSPEGSLAYLPFAALAPSLPVAYVPSGTALGELTEERSKRGVGVLALGDADYLSVRDATARAVYGSHAALSALPGTRAEVTAIGDPTTTLLGAGASEAGLRAALAARPDRWRAVHFACHGLVDRRHPARSALALSPDASNDGYLTALEVLGTAIPADLVTLSACETGQGRIVMGEGIVGLARAFMYAGAPRVICSLWKVDDDATRVLMTKFYSLWNPKDGKPGLPTAEALKRAQEFVKSQERWKHPYYWAAWVLWGVPE